MIATAEPKRLTTDLPESDGLSDQQREFVTHYLRFGNGSKAAEAVGLKWPRVAGSRWLQNAAIKEAIHNELKARHIDADQVLAELSTLSYANMADFMDEDGSIDTDKVRKGGHLVKKYTETERTGKDGTLIVRREIELHDRHAALVDVGKKYRMFQTDTVNNIQINVFAELNKELAPLLNECLDPLKRERFALGLSEIARKHGHQAPAIPTAVSVLTNMPPIVENQPEAVAVNVELENQVKPVSNGNNGHSKQNGE